MLPGSLEQLPEYKAWEERWEKIVDKIVLGFANVHALVTSADQLQQFRALPYMVVEAWAGSDDLVVDSEDSVSVALDWWVRGDEGSRCSQQQLKKLGGLLRVKHMGPGMYGRVISKQCITTAYTATITSRSLQG
jgi:hypothetical protein